ILYISHRLPDSVRSQFLQRNVPWCTGNDLTRGHDLSLNHPSNTAWADTQMPGSLFQGQEPVLLFRIESRKLIVPTCGINSLLIPVIACSGLEPEAIEGDGDLFVRMFHGHLSNDFNRLQTRASTVLTRTLLPHP